ncbi:MAG: hypothetical protein M3Y66_06480 [Actinomycetota bacterium]|nr:hypothetical protein [Actinomycetota bacterium]
MSDRFVGARWRTAVWSLVALLLAVVAAGCAGGQRLPAVQPSASDSSSAISSATSEAPPAPGVHLSFIQQRFDEGTNRAQVRVINNTSRIVHVRKVGVVWPGFPTGLQPMDYPVPGGLTIDLRYFLPRADCSAQAGTAAEYAVVTTTRGRILQPMPADGRRFLTRLWRTTCNARRIRHAASISYGDSWSEEGTGLKAVLHGRLVLTRRDDREAVTVDQVQGSVLFALKTPGGTMLPRDASEVSLPLDISPGRCDQHGRSQSTQSFLFRVWVKLGNGHSLAQVAEPTKGQQERLLAFLDHACGKLSGG